MLDAVVELPRHCIGNVDRVLCDEVDANSLGSDQPHHLLDLVDQRRRGVVEQQVRFVEEETQLRAIGIADFGQGFEQFRQQPQQEGGVELRRGHQPVRGQNVHHPAPAVVGAQEIGKVECRLAEETLAALAAQLQQRTLDGADRLLRYIAVGAGEFACPLRAMRQHRLQVIKIEQQQAVFVRDMEGNGQHAFLHLVQPQQPGEHQRAHFRYGGADRVALFAIQVPELHRRLDVMPI